MSKNIPLESARLRLKGLQRQGWASEDRLRIMRLYHLLALLGIFTSKIMLANERAIDELNYGTQKSWADAEDALQALLKDRDDG